MKKLFVCIFVLTLACSTTLLAADRPLVAHADHVIVGKAAPDTSNDPTLCNSIGPASDEFGDSGFYVAGPTNPVFSHSQFIAVPCTPKANHNLTTVKGAWQWAGLGHNTIQICLYSDNGSNAPGTQIGNCVNKNNLPAYLTTNTLVTANFTSQNLALTGGTQYWIVAQTPSTGAKADATDVWVGGNPWTSSDVAGNGWGSFQADYVGAMKVSGQ